MAKLTGTNPDQVPTNADLGDMAYKDGENLQAGPLTIKDGDVGVGTTSPASELHVTGSAYTPITIDGTSGATIDFYRNGSRHAQIFTDNTGGDIVFRNNTTTERMRINSSGDVAISGDLTGLRYFDVYNTGSTSTDGAIVRLITEQVGSTSTTSADIIKRKNGEFRITNFETDASAYIAFNVGSSERMKITSSGEVQVTSGLLELDGNDIGGTQVTIADDAVASITPPRNGGFMTIILNGDGSFPLQGHQAMLRYDVGSSLAVSEAIGAGSIDVSTSDVSGTTGTDGNTTVAVQTGVIKIENRSGSSGTYQITFL